MPAAEINPTSSARVGGVFRYWMTSGSYPLSRNRSSVLRDVEHFGLWKMVAAEAPRRRPSAEAAMLGRPVEQTRDGTVVEHRADGAGQQRCDRQHRQLREHLLLADRQGVG